MSELLLDGDDAIDDGDVDEDVVEQNGVDVAGDDGDSKVKSPMIRACLVEVQPRAQQIQCNVFQTTISPPEPSRYSVMCSKLPYLLQSHTTT
ncbi:hypothetical protein RRG08_032746 [Elysia crispata]|uniref:Uncharacterized protein n=1 Tax=Elysia crispata TaxID=231223 RepID=A0AAE0YVU6_9GAST|nr:hypothetical protein RRG08_032746 [Elysia crispata]